MAELDEKKIEKMKVAELKTELTKRGLPTTGLKNELAKRLLDSLSTSKNVADESNSDTEETETSKGKRLKSSGNESNKRRKTSTKDETSEEDVVFTYEPLREGPSDVQMIPMAKESKGTGTITINENGEIATLGLSYYLTDYVMANVKVDKGSWYYELKVAHSGQIQFGWGTSNFSPRGDIGEYWMFSPTDQHKYRSKQNSQKYGEHCNSGDVVGCSLDTKSKIIKYFKNGKDLGVAFNDVSPPSGEKLTPMILIGGSSRCSVNFGKTPFSYPQDGYLQLQVNLSLKEIRNLYVLFLHYKNVGKQDKSNSDSLTDSINLEGLGQLQKDLGAPDEDDPVLLIIAWKLRSSSLWEISKDEWINGFMHLGVKTLDDISTRLGEWRKELKQKDSLFKNFYNYVFDYLKEDKTVILLEEALVAWNIVLKERSWPLFNKFVEFLHASQKKAISRDVWQQLWHFMQAYPSDLKDYDSSGCWPILYDEFAGWMTETKK